MASRLLNRRELREQADQAEALGQETPAEPAKAKRAPKAKIPGAPKVRKPRAKKAPPRMCARWAIVDSTMKQVAVFNYNQQDLAGEKLAELLLKKKGGYYMQIVKEQMLEPEVVAPPAP